LEIKADEGRRRRIPQEDKRYFGMPCCKVEVQAYPFAGGLGGLDMGISPGRRFLLLKDQLGERDVLLKPISANASFLGLGVNG
jgi:hypothetical protein